MNAYATSGGQSSDQRYLALLKEAARRNARRSLLAFTEYTKPDYSTNWHHQLLAEKLDRFIKGDIKFLMVFMPPQHGKSELSTRRLAAKILGDHPDKRVAAVAYNHDFAAKFNRDIQRIIDSPEYRELYPGTTLYGKNIRVDSQGSWLRNSDEFEIVGHKGSLISVGVGGGLTGNKVDVALIDDPYKDAVQANSQAYRSMLEEWWDAVLETRLHNESQICLTFTRWRHDDIAGKLLDLQKQGLTTRKWEVVRFEAIREMEDIEGDPRRPGEALWPQQHSLEKLGNMRASNPLVFEAMYQQRPTPKAGNLVKEEYLRSYELGAVPDSVPTHFYVDTATSEAELKNNDPTGILAWKYWKGGLYLIYFEKGRWSAPDLIEKVKWVHEKFGSGRASKWYIENKSNGRSTKQILDKGTNINVLLDNIKGGKIERLENELPTLEAGRVFLPMSDGWVEGFKAHLLGFPLMKHDEEVDCLTGAMRKAFGTPGGIRFANPTTSR